ncbi:isochorismatase [Rhodococcus sp. 06-156-3C]|uniref:isochorismatase family protein n=1 Tax=Nocardiaceae TaxID=85025 RepID=UPI00068970C8|nr:MULTISPECIES: isochorismatase family protein [Rhodococcus]OZD12590.1 isochorismatase [Rhodococcus sp. 06-156-4a]OZD18001.1 isochorismatase [Rhodococcus sp. 06-156-3C]OZD20439.1 isochorismatase [Rhodococcus sp. 06-156-4C]OZD29283.1 isochorismatase [Rhodococcus sp. 06-156-3]OZD30555.1 isochorismatase [Rhodococcus sp. 06-156-3b]
MITTDSLAPFAGRVGWGVRPALIVVDLVNAYVDHDGVFALPHMEKVIEATARLVEVMRSAGFPVVWTDVRYDETMVDAGLFGKKVPGLAAFAKGSPKRAGELVLTPEPGDIRITKHYASSFFSTSLASTLHTAGVDTILVGGVSTSGCVRATAMDGLNHGFRPQVIRETCADRTKEVHESNLADLDAKYADVCHLREAITRIDALAGTENPS